jgi:hypothetical protein
VIPRNRTVAAIGRPGRVAISTTGLRRRPPQPHCGNRQTLPGNPLDPVSPHESGQGSRCPADERCDGTEHLKQLRDQAHADHGAGQGLAPGLSSPHAARYLPYHRGRHHRAREGRRLGPQSFEEGSCDSAQGVRQHAGRKQRCEKGCVRRNSRDATQSQLEKAPDQVPVSDGVRPGHTRTLSRIGTEHAKGEQGESPPRRESRLRASGPTAYPNAPSIDSIAPRSASLTACPPSECAPATRCERLTMNCL